MNTVSVPRSLRSTVVAVATDDGSDFDASLKFTVACLVAAGSITGAEAQNSPLPPVTIDAPVARPRPPAEKPTAEHVQVRAKVRQLARERPKQPRTRPSARRRPPRMPRRIPTRTAADRDPYANPAAPYKAERLASPKFTEPLLNTPRSVTVLTKEILEDKNATTLKEVARTTAGVTLGTGEGGNAFGDRFFIRGFDARNDIFVDGVRDPAVSIRENFFTEQVEILRGPASSFAGRGTTGGAINIVTKQAGDRRFLQRRRHARHRRHQARHRRRQPGHQPDASRCASTAWSRTPTSPAATTSSTIAGAASRRSNGRRPTASRSRRTTSTPTSTRCRTSACRITGRRIAPFTEFGVPRNTFYGFVNRDFQKVTAGHRHRQRRVQAHRRSDGHQQVPGAAVDPRLHRHAAGGARNSDRPPHGLFSSIRRAAIRSTDVIANQTDVTIKFDTGPIKNTAVVGAEILARTRQHRQLYGADVGSARPAASPAPAALANVSIFNPPQPACRFRIEPR